MDDDEIEYTILNRRDVNAYKVPPRTSSGGPRAEEWKNCIWSGKVWVIGKGADAIIRLVHSSSGDLFLQSVITGGEHEKFVERTVDSSRYFVIKVVHPKTKSVAFIGLGFEDRNDAFDFNCALSDFKSRNDEPKAAETGIFSGEKKDYSLKEGEKITINIKSHNKKSSGKNQEQGNTTETVPMFLPPPPSSATRTSGDSTKSATSTNANNPFADDYNANVLRDPQEKAGSLPLVPSDTTNPFANFDPFTGITDEKTKPAEDDPFAGDDDFFGDFQS